MTPFADERPKPLNDAAQTVFDCVQRMAEQATNAVLQVLGECREMREGQQYPQPPLGFADGRWRAYYHSHALATASAGEHGHFHIFVASGDGGGPHPWTHLAGLAMDREGQPLRWFATNRWVTSGPWGRRDALLAEIECLQPTAGDSLLAQWLMAMVCLYKADIAELLDVRDDRILKAMHNASMNEVLTERSLYELAESRIDLLHRLQKQLLSSADINLSKYA